jgi:Flp pilus assembly protein TadG
MGKRRGSRGQATVELAIVLPILIWLLLGLVDIARMASAYLIVQHAAREAVRLGVTGASDDDLRNRVLETVETLDTSRLSISITPSGARPTGSDITVQVSYRYKVMALMGFIGAEVPLQGRLTARVE